MDEMTTGPDNSFQSKDENLPFGVDVGSSVDKALWSLLVQLSRKLQVSSASIKAGVSSLMDYNIFWDGSTQFEFLESINNSTDQASRLVMLLSLIFRSTAGSLEMKTEPHVLQEIVSMAREQFQKDSNRLVIEIALPQNGKPVLVDYEYLMLGLRFLFEVLAYSCSEPETMQIFAYETGTDWILDIVNRTPIMAPIALLVKDNILELLNDKSMNAENRLKLYVIFRIFIHMRLSMEFIGYADQKIGLRIHVPTAAV